MRSMLLALVAWFALCPGLVVAALDVEAKAPYRLRVVLRCGDHPDFTPHFRAELRRNLQGSLQAAFGSLGSVEAIDLGDVPAEKLEPLWKTFDEKGFAGLDAENGVTGIKTHFLKIEYSDGQYVISARQCDGVTGFVNSTARKASTSTRSFVSRLAVLTIGQDLGIVGTIDGAGGRNQVQVKLKGGALGIPMDRWVKKGDVFAVVQIRPAPRRRPDPKAKGPLPPSATEVGSRVDGVLLQAAEDARDGAVTCRLFNRYEDPLAMRGGVLGYRCVKLGTTDAPLRLQLVDAAGVPHRAQGLQVRIHTDHFPEKPGEGEDVPARSGVFQSRTPLNGLALAQVSVAGRDIARIPIEILGDHTVVRQVRIEPGAEARGRLEQSRRDLIGRITDARLMQVRCFKDLIALEGAKKNKEALDRAESARKLLDTEAVELRQDIERLATRAKRDLPGGDGFAADCEQQMLLLKAKQDELVTHIGVLQEAVRIENDPVLKAKRNAIQEKIRHAELLWEQAEFDAALAAYDEALAGIEDADAKAKVQATRDARAKIWATKDAEHAAARKFVFEKWPGLADAKQVRDALPEARKAFDKCKAVGDKLTLSKMALAAPEVVNKIAEQIKPLVGSEEEEDIARLDAIKKVSEDLEKFLKDVTAYVTKPAKK